MDPKSWAWKIFDADTDEGVFNVMGIDIHQAVDKELEIFVRLDPGSVVLEGWTDPKKPGQT
jgi:hypothetical protein